MTCRLLMQRMKMLPIGGTSLCSGPQSSSFMLVTSAMTTSPKRAPVDPCSPDSQTRPSPEWSPRTIPRNRCSWRSYRSCWDRLRTWSAFPCTRPRLLSCPSRPRRWGSWLPAPNLSRPPGQLAHPPRKQTPKRWQRCTRPRSDDAESL